LYTATPELMFGESGAGNFRPRMWCHQPMNCELYVWSFWNAIHIRHNIERIADPPGRKDKALSLDEVTIDGGSGLDIGFIDHFNTQFNYSAISDLHTLQITVTHAKSFRTCIAFTCSRFITASNNGCRSASVLESSFNDGSLPAAWLPHNRFAAISHQLSSLLFTASLSTEQVVTLSLADNVSARTT
jgi:hypothetical protein